MKAVKYFTINFSTKPSDVGYGFPQIADYRKVREDNPHFSIDEFCEFKGVEYFDTPDLNNYILSKRALPSDLISCGLCPGGDLLISEKFRNILFKYKLGPSQFFPATVEIQKKYILNYYLLHFNYSLEKFIDFKSTIYNSSHFPESSLDSVVDYDSYIDFKTKHKRKLLLAQKLVMRKNFDTSLDLFVISWIEQAVLISEKLKHQLVAENISGIEFGEFTLYVQNSVEAAPA